MKYAPINRQQANKIIELMKEKRPLDFLFIKPFTDLLGKFGPEPDNLSEDGLILWTGAKLRINKYKQRIRPKNARLNDFTIIGYSEDGSDVEQVIDAITEKPNKEMKFRINDLGGMLEVIINEQHTITISKDDKNAVMVELFNNQIPEHWPDDAIDNDDFVVFNLPPTIGKEIQDK